MSKVVMSLPKGMVKSSIIGGFIALAAYVALQLLCALLVHRELLGEESLYPMVCVAAAAASFLGCGYSVLSRREGAVLTVSAVTIVFLALTLAVALLTEKTVAVENGLVGVGLSMAAGGLAAALVGANLPRQGRKRTAQQRKNSRHRK